MWSSFQGKQKTWSFWNKIAFLESWFPHWYMVKKLNRKLWRRYQLLEIDCHVFDYISLQTRNDWVMTEEWWINSNGSFVIDDEFTDLHIFHALHMWWAWLNANGMKLQLFLDWSWYTVCNGLGCLNCDPPPLAVNKGICRIFINNRNLGAKVCSSHINHLKKNFSFITMKAFTELIGAYFYVPKAP